MCLCLVCVSPPLQFVGYFFFFFSRQQKGTRGGNLLYFCSIRTVPFVFLLYCTVVYCTVIPFFFLRECAFKAAVSHAVDSLSASELSVEGCYISRSHFLSQKKRKQKKCRKYWSESSLLLLRRNDNRRACFES